MEILDKIMKINNEYIKFFSTKQLLYISTLIEYSLRKKKGLLYKKYKDYFKMYDNINLDDYKNKIDKLKELCKN